jgi:hypothetical protein
MRSKRLIIPLVLLLTAPALAQAASAPKAGSYGGTHGFDGPIYLKFERESGIGLYLARFSFSGTLVCPDGTKIPYSFRDRRVTARTAARVAKRKFTAKASDITIAGTFGERGIKGTVKLRASPCEKTVSYSVKRR